MWQLIEMAFPQALAMAISPIPLVAVIALASARRSAALAFTIGWVAAIFVTISAAALAGGAAAPPAQDPRVWSAVLKAVVGVLMITLAVRSWMGRPRGEEAPEPGWLGSVSSWGLAKGFAGGAVLAILNAKNLPIMATLGASIGTAHLGAGQAGVTIAVIAVVGAVGAVFIVGDAYLGGQGAERRLAGLRAFLVRWNNVIVAVMFGYLGVQSVLNALTTLFS